MFGILIARAVVRACRMRREMLERASTPEKSYMDGNGSVGPQKAAVFRHGVPTQRYISDVGHATSEVKKRARVGR